MDWNWPPNSQWLNVSEPAIAAVVFTALGIYAIVILLTRLAGLRSFSKISSFDFAITVAIGSVIASTVVLKSVSLMKGAVALAALYTVQFVAAVLREHSSLFGSMVNNQAILLMAGEEVLEENLHKAQMTRGDLRSKLREANVIHPSQVRAVVMETTGDVSVLHAGPGAPALDPDLLSDVRDVERLKSKPNVRDAERS